MVTTAIRNVRILIRLCEEKVFCDNLKIYCLNRLVYTKHLLRILVQLHSLGCVKRGQFDSFDEATFTGLVRLKRSREFILIRF